MYRVLFSRRLFAVFPLFAAVMWSGPALAAGEDVMSYKAQIDLTWLMTASSLVMMMQVGFLLLEAGMVRSKNSINVAQKNLLDFVFGIVAFASVGFMIAFAPSAAGLIGFSNDFLMLGDLDSWEAGFFVFQVMFCGTAATIVSGAVAERMKLSAYVAGSIFMSAVIYPVFVHWAWGSALAPNSGAFLSNLGFVDFAGSTVVHATGGWVSLAACLVIGARRNRFLENGEITRISGHSPVLSTTGAFLLFFGWLGFNGGSTLRMSADVPMIILNTVLAGGMGASVGYVMGLRNGVILPEKSFTGMLGGLVAVTAGCHILTPSGALAIGAVGAAAAIYSVHAIERYLRIDDAVGAVGVHAVAGLVGTLLLAFLAPVDNLPNGGRWAQFEIQLLGSAINFVWAFSMGYAFFWLLDKVSPIRVSPEAEDIGLNVAEHDTRLGVGHVETALTDLLNGSGNLKHRLPDDNGGEAETLTGLFNRLMDTLEAREKERLEVEHAKRDLQEADRVAALANAALEAILVHIGGTIVDANDQFSKLFGGPRHEVIGRGLLDFVTSEEAERLKPRLGAQGEQTFETMMVSADGEHIPIEVRSRSIFYRAKPARVVCIIDLRERKAAEQRIRYMAQHDPLTGLPNRVLFNEELARRTASSEQGASHALALVDIDHFKDINDVYGHQAGDKVICEVSRRLSEVSGAHTMVARLGGDEFAVIILNAAFENQLTDLGLRLVRAFRTPVDIGGGVACPVSVSIGMARCPDHAEKPDDLIALADIALYESKNAGRNRWTIFRPGMNELTEKRRELEAKLAQALERREFELYLQPRVDTLSASISGYEALLRWRDADGQMISPTDFIPVAEASGLIVPIGLWVVSEACRLLAEQLPEGKLSINVSPLQFRQPGFVDSLVAIVDRAGVSTDRLELEITESVLIDDDARALAILQDLKRKGFEIALDDFGTGYSSLSYLSRFPFDTIKIDRSFVANLDEAESSGVIIRTIAALGRGLGMTLVAEGVETIEAARFLTQIGCHELQGFLLGKPVAAESRAKGVDADVAEVILSAASAASTFTQDLKDAADRLKLAGSEISFQKTA
ncbi:Amt family ammonium transporter [Rhizobium sp. SG_E_25_P2]|uniref:ammonium transporter n=1 Tax=Rhizobium sp. SG_E_25_P2 TaxID=2879942 RepID=UPI00247532F1|nr:ammonium transporter [Rhizobium sp. SG_E_25_P2]MDH6268885.1 Amt family ammonium transporter [Rhizobium sp. SG_E_25_P2]